MINPPTVIVALIVVAIIALAVRKLIKDKKSGKKGCSCGCSSCAMKDICHGDKEKK